MKIKQAVLVTLLACLAANPGVTQPGQSQSHGVITVVGDGVVSVVPDMASISVGVVAEDSQAREAIRRMSEQASAMHASLASAGIASADIRTGSLSLRPAYKPAGAEKGELPGVETFTAATDAEIRVRNLDQLGTLLDRIVHDGANTIHRLQLDVQDRTTLEHSAQVAAVQDAVRKAEIYAAAAGLQLGMVKSIDEQGANIRPMRLATTARAGMEGVPIAAGEMTVSASVTMVFELISSM